MSTSSIHIIPEDDVPSPNVKKQVKYKLVKLPFDNKQSSKKQDGNKSHTQLFLKMTDKMESKKGIPSYYRGVRRVDEKVPHIYWYDAALKAYSGSTIIWSIDKAKMTRSKLSWIKRPRIFSIANTMLENRSVFKSSGGRNEPKGCSGEVVTPYDHSCVQMYEWVRYNDGSGWAFIFRNDPSKPLVELRKTSSRNEFEIVFLQDSPPGWSSRTRQHSNVFNPFNHSPRSAGRHPSAFSNPSTSHRTSNTSGLSNTSKERSFNTDDAERYWQEFVLASTVAIQDEVISSKKRLWKN